MSLTDIQNRQSILKAVREFDQLGRSAFLTKYGFAEARRYFLVLDGRLYDSKAIVGAAHGFEFPDQGSLRPGEFSGGDATVRRKLETLGFQVKVAGNSTVGTSRTYGRNHFIGNR